MDFTATHTYQPNPVDGRTYTDADYKRAADMNLRAAKMMRLQGDQEAAAAHRRLADLYIKQELRRSAA